MKDDFILISKALFIFFIVFGTIGMSAYYYENNYNNPVRKLDRMCIKSKSECGCLSGGFQNILSGEELRKFADADEYQAKGFIAGLPLDKQMRIAVLLSYCSDKK